MIYESTGAVAPEGLPCRYGASKLLFRGPRRRLDGRYIAFLGGIETYGKFVRHAFPTLIEQQLGLDCVNLGVANAGLDALISDPELTGIAVGAEYRVLQVPAAQTLSNRLYKVHPRRNDRFLAASPMLGTVYREVDFTEFTFVNHMLSTLYKVSPERFEIVREELRQAWTARMRLLLSRIGPKTLLLWLRFEGARSKGDDARLGHEPMFVTQDMVEALREDADEVLRIPVQAALMTTEIEDMVFAPDHEAVAGSMIGPATHKAIATTMLPHLRAAF